ncbi:flagellar hook assembly protein FlgD [Marinimicrobium alkaliphilum]|uniref:flagellar hook assembly protein FlgD n=1 Tax=Marinimicrobium alkaliphilum TaxID=2202654 RepID=UPI000DBA56D7|nr:flagellar hook assembly protein FlgD [Marinimicrobium alkaliphilum]
MSQVDNNQSVNHILSHLDMGNKFKDERKDNELGQSAFLELMIAQLNNQDPLSPQENSEFVAQLAQFSSVEGLERLNENFDGFANSFMSSQALQASSLVGRSVSVPSNSTQLQEGGIVSGSVKLDATTTDMRINIYDSMGSLAAQVPVGYAEAGDNIFRWDGHRMEVNGKLLDWSAGEEPFPPGDYRFEVLATQEGEVEQLETALSANVNSVTLGKDGRLILNLAGIGPVSMTEVKQFN